MPERISYMTFMEENAGIFILVLLVLAVILLVLVLLQNSRIKELDRRIFDLSAGTDGESLEDTLVKVFDAYDGINKQLDQNTGDIRDIYRRLHSQIQKVGVVKYDAFRQMGGNLSSVIVLLDQDNNGVLLNTVQNTDGCYSYVKEIRRGKSDIAYTEEEQKAVDQALNTGKAAAGSASSSARRQSVRQEESPPARNRGDGWEENRRRPPRL